MNNLWIFSKAPNEKSVGFLLSMIDKYDAVVFIQDGVYALMHNKLDLSSPIYALKSDIVARGITTDFAQITYAEFIDLIFKYQRTVTI